MLPRVQRHAAYICGRFAPSIVSLAVGTRPSTCRTGGRDVDGEWAAFQGGRGCGQVEPACPRNPTALPAVALRPARQSPMLLGLRLVADGVDVCELAPPLGGGLEAELVDPHVCSELDALVHRHGLVHRPLVCRHGLVVVGGRPQDRTSLGRGDLDAAADGGEGGFSAGVHLGRVWGRADSVTVEEKSRGEERRGELTA